MKNILRILIVLFVFVAGFCCFFRLFQEPVIYYNTFGLISYNYEYAGDGMRTKVKTPYISITNENVVQWDGAHYKEIKDYGYKRKAEIGHDYIFAFFPLFPYIWKVSDCSARKMIFLNFLMFTIGLLILLLLFKKSVLYAMLILSLPLTVTFFYSVYRSYVLFNGSDCHIGIS